MDPINTNSPHEAIPSSNEVNFTPIEAQRVRQTYESVQLLWKALNTQMIFTSSLQVGPVEAAQANMPNDVQAETQPTTDLDVAIKGLPREYEDTNA